MNYRFLGNTGVKVSELCLGTMTFGTRFLNIGVIGQEGATAMVRKALEAGVNFFDTADLYSFGESEELTGLRTEAGRRGARFRAGGPRPGARTGPAVPRRRTGGAAVVAALRRVFDR